QPDAEQSEAETLAGRLRFGGFSTASAAIHEAGVLIEVDAQLRTDLAAGASLPIRLAEVSAAVGASPGLSKSNGAGDFTNATIAVVDGAVQVVAIPTDFALQPNYPNPFNPATRIQYQLPEVAMVKLDIFNALGQKVRTLVNGGQQAAGYYNLEWNGRNDAEITVPSGIYFYRFEAKGAAKTFAKTRKMLMVK
ncbi:MAG: FlgD immunoglobulin-like domain containing protein, partial [bacterium]